MPPKAGKKATAKKKDRLIEDKTFGLKNKKKSKKVQAFVAQVTKQVRDGGPRKARMTPEEKAAAEVRKMKREKKQAEKEMAMLMGMDVPKKKKKSKKKDGEGEEAAGADAGEVKSAAEMAKEEFAASLEAMATVPPVSMVEVTLDGTLEIGDHAIGTVEDEIERRREELHKKAKKVAGKPPGATKEQLATFKKKRDALRKKEQKKAELELYGKGGRKGMCGREIILKNIKSSGGVALDAPEDEGDDSGTLTAQRAVPASGAAAATAAATTASGAGDDDSGAAAAAAAATVGDADVFLEGDDDDLDDLDDDDLEDDEEGDAGAVAAPVAALP